MKRFLSLSFAMLLLVFSICGCSVIYEDIAVSELAEIAERVESQFVSPLKRFEVGEISYDEPFVYNTYYDSGYTVLNEKQREIYENLYLIALQMPEGYVRLCEYYDNYYEDTGLAYNAMINDHPSFFWMPYTYFTCEAEDSDGDFVCIAFQLDEEGNQNDYLVEKSSREQMQQELDLKINEIINKSMEYSSAYSKVEFFNNYICDNTEYNENADLCQTVYGCLINGQALCEGYSRAFKLLCNKVGIRCDLVYGKSENENHMWNCVGIGNNYSHTDVTWNDNGEEYRYMYLNMTDAQAKADRYFFPHFSEIPKGSIKNGDIINFVNHQCDYKGNSYYSKNGLVLSGENPKKIAAKIKKAAQEGKQSIQLMIYDEQILNEISDKNTDEISEIQNELGSIIINEYQLERDVLTLFFACID